MLPPHREQTSWKTLLACINDMVSWHTLSNDFCSCCFCNHQRYTLYIYVLSHRITSQFRCVAFINDCVDDNLWGKLSWLGNCLISRAYVFRQHSTIENEIHIEISGVVFLCVLLFRIVVIGIHFTSVGIMNRYVCIEHVVYLIC